MIPIDLDIRTSWVSLPVPTCPSRDLLLRNIPNTLNGYLLPFQSVCLHNHLYCPEHIIPCYRFLVPVSAPDFRDKPPLYISVQQDYQLQYQSLRIILLKSQQKQAPMISTADSALLQLHFTTGSEWASSNATASSSPKTSLRWLMNLFDKRQNGSQRLTN